MRNTLAVVPCVARKEFRSFFASPAAYLFLGGFLATNLFIFFWVETYFARNIADVRPLFQWMPILLIFLVAALTMRTWAEEHRGGTLENLLTAPVNPLGIVLGKFCAVMGLIVLALVLTLPLPLTAFVLGPLDWGPVLGGYVATLFLAGAYVAIGLYMSARTDNPIVALMLTSVVCGVLYLLGSSTLTRLFGYDMGKWLALIGTGSRFDSITRGVLDLRDLYYYVSIAGVFLCLNLFSLERLRWAGNPLTKRHLVWGWMVGLAMANFVAANFWLQPVSAARVDMTQGNIYSLSQATNHQLSLLREPLLIRGYFSDRTHPLLAPLVPRLKDLMEEYAIAGNGKVRVEMIDPTRDKNAEEEAASRFGVRPTPFQTADRYQAAVVNSYFDVVIAYGDQYEKLGFQDLIEVKFRGEEDVDVVLKNPEYAITRAIRKVAGAWQAGGNPFENMQDPVTLKAFISPDKRLPETLRALRNDLHELVEEYRTQANGKLIVQVEDPDSGNSDQAASLRQRYGIGPHIANLFNPQPFWFSLILEGNHETVPVPLPETLDKAGLERSLKAALQRLTPGVLKTIALVKPAPYGPHARRYTDLEKVLAENARLKETDLKEGMVPDDADLLLVLAPSNLDDRQVFAIDQFLMQGGSVIMATSPFDVRISNTILAQPHEAGLEDLLAHYGLSMDKSMVLDRYNAALPVPVERYVGGLTLREIRMLPYPHFPDLRGTEQLGDNPITSSLGQLTLNWASPITVDKEKNKDRHVIELLHSSPESWTSDDLDVMPNYRLYPQTGFAVTGTPSSHVLAVAIQGRLDSFFKGKKSPLLATTEAEAQEENPKGDQKGTQEDEESRPRITSIIDHSPGTSRLVLIASNAFASDTSIDLISQGLGTHYTKPLDFIQNAVDWSLEDRGLLALRGRTQLARTLYPLPQGGQRMWELGNYCFALFELLLIWLWRRWVTASDGKRYEQVLAEV
ncbi:Gldg family protein [Desulfoplanes formicivorans]|uniref:ABC transporter permease n=1 Tax=Desulfoplanes formicivorans TaxID=1592317 RepID=A0A194AKL7_9BACT|nr:Gldg family protein [Desulfoplanes formicivorans]GAU09254.1 ABC transporter permease [Desulfoplanes formicivorans]